MAVSIFLWFLLSYKFLVNCQETAEFSTEGNIQKIIHCDSEQSCNDTSIDTNPTSSMATNAPVSGAHTAYADLLTMKSNPLCRAETECDKLPVDCIVCSFNYSCVYGRPLNVSCQVASDIDCKVRSDSISCSLLSSNNLM